MVLVLDELQGREPRPCLRTRGTSKKLSLSLNSELAIAVFAIQRAPAYCRTSLGIVEIFRRDAALAVWSWRTSLMSSRPRAAHLSADERQRKALYLSKESKLAIAVFAEEVALMNWRTSLRITEVLRREAAFAVWTWCASLMSSWPRAASLSADDRQQNHLAILKQQACDRGLRSVGCPSALKTITRHRSSLPP